MAENPLQKEAETRLELAREWKNRRLLDFKECYFFACPSRQRQLSSATKPGTTSMMDEPELNTDIAMLLVGDFTTEIINTYMPEAQQWCERGPGMDVKAGDVSDDILAAIKAGDKQIFDAIKSSNFYAELPKALNPDLAIGGAALWIHRPKAHLPIEVLAVPLRELEINLGPNGEIDDRFVVRWARNNYVQTLVGEEVWAKISDDKKNKLATDDKGYTEVRWGFWRLWQRLDQVECWQHVVMLGNELVYDSEYNGQGSCPLLVFRFNAVADWPWAIGPMIQALPTLRQVDEIEMQKTEAVERAVNPAIKYPDDSVANLEQGLEAGMGYPVRPGSGNDFGPIYQQPPIEPALIELEDKFHRLRKLFFVDHPEQTGDTPPTLGQWLDELARMQRRIGMAGFSFWREGPMRIFLRFKFLLEAVRTIQPIMDRRGQPFATMPYNPTQRAAEQQEIATAMQAAQIGSNLFPEEWRFSVDGAATIKKFIQKMRVSSLIVMRSQGQVQGALQQIASIAGVRQRAGAQPPEEAGPPASA